jgi:hypothetical protein
MNVPLMDVSVPLTELNNQIVSVEMDSMMSSLMLNVNHVTIDVILVKVLLTIVSIVLLIVTESYQIHVSVLMDTMKNLVKLNVNLVDTLVKLVLMN